MPTRNVVLTDYHEELLEKLVSSGKYQNASEVLREGLRLVERQHAEHEAKLKALRDAVQEGIDDIEAGRFKEFDSVDELDKHLEALAKAAMERKRV